MEQSTAPHREPQNKQSIESLPENATPHPTASHEFAAKIASGVLFFAEEGGGNGVAAFVGALCSQRIHVTVNGEQE